VEVYERIEFTGYDPGDWTPRGGEEEDVNTDESN
jgi:hypothetical protein